MSITLEKKREIVESVVSAQVDRLFKSELVENQEYAEACAAVLYAEAVRVQTMCGGTIVGALEQPTFVELVVSGMEGAGFVFSDELRKTLLTPYEVR